MAARKDQQFKVALDWEMDQMLRRQCARRMEDPQAVVRRWILEGLGGPGYLAVDVDIRKEVRSEMVRGPRSVVAARAAVADPMDLPSPMGPCPSEGCPSRDPDWSEWVLYGGDQPLLSVSGGRYRCNACGVSGP